MVVGSREAKRRSRRESLHVKHFKMSKSANTREFRKVDVDKFDEDRFQDDQAEEEQDTGPSEADIQQLLMSYPLPCSLTTA